MKNKYIAMTTSIIAICVTLLQGYLGYLSKTKELELSEIKSKANYKLAQLHEDRTWKYNMVEFLAKYRHHIFSNNINEREEMKNIMMIAFPEEITSNIFLNFYKISNKHKIEWEKALSTLKVLKQESISLERGRYEYNPNSLNKAKILPKLKECEQAIKELKLLQEQMNKEKSTLSQTITGSTGNNNLTKHRSQ